MKANAGREDKHEDRLGQVSMQSKISESTSHLNHLPQPPDVSLQICSRAPVPGIHNHLGDTKDRSIANLGLLGPKLFIQHVVSFAFVHHGEDFRDVSCFGKEACRCKEDDL